MNILLILAQCISISSGTVVVDGTEQKITQGTFCPDPYDKELAKSIVEKNAEIERWKIRYESVDLRMKKIEDYWNAREEKVDKFYNSRIQELALAVEISNGWWQTWGKTTLVAIIAVAAAGFVTYEVVK